VLESRQIRRVGGTRNIDVDVRVISATNRNLAEAIKSGQFREDLFYRLNVFPILVPPLRERREDIPVLAAFYLEKYSRDFSRGFQGIDPAATRLLEGYHWPGNIRELKNIIEKICIIHQGPLLLPTHLPPEISGKTADPLAAQPLSHLVGSVGLEEAVEQIERSLIADALTRSNGNVLKAAELLRVPRGTLRYKLTKYGLDR
jgi:transcriptional regulator with PAS, ATPase and Fis domain